jgi:hypothetical protein
MPKKTPTPEVRRKAIERRRANKPTIRQIRSITDPIVPLEFAGLCHDMGRTQSYDSARDGTFPVEVIRRGRRVYVSTMALWRSLGIEPDSGRKAS